MALLTMNFTDNRRVWVTIYNLFGHQTDYGWLEANGERTWTGFGGIKVRGEVKSDAEGNDPTIYDTEMNFNNVGGDPQMVQIVKGSDNYYWVGA